MIIGVVILSLTLALTSCLLLYLLQLGSDLDSQIRVLGRKKSELELVVLSKEIELKQAREQLESALEQLRLALEGLDQARVQLAGCSVVAMGSASQQAQRGDYGWSVSYADVLRLRQDYDRVLKDNEELPSPPKPLDTDRPTRSIWDHLREEETDSA